MGEISHINWGNHVDDGEDLSATSPDEPLNPAELPYESAVPEYTVGQTQIPLVQQELGRRTPGMITLHLPPFEEGGGEPSL